MTQRKALIQLGLALAAISAISAIALPAGLVAQTTPPASGGVGGRGGAQVIDSAAL